MSVAVPRSSRLAACLVLPALLMGGSVGGHTPATAGSAWAPGHSGDPRQGRDVEIREAFGFQLGEERRYTLGPDRALQPGETMLWTMLLEAIEGQPADFRATFILTSESLRFARNNNILNPDDRTGDRTRVKLVVNQYGFPLQVIFDRNREGSEVSYSHEEVRLDYDGEKYLVENDLAMGIREFNIRVRSSDYSDPTIPRGVYLAPSVNPGLLTIIYRSLFEPGVEKMQYLELRPASLARRRTAFNSPFGDSRSEPGRRRELDREEYRVGDFLTIEVGTRRLDAIELEDPRVDGHSYVDQDGRVLKIDTRIRDRDVWIRMLHPWEY